MFDGSVLTPVIETGVVMWLLEIILLNILCAPAGCFTPGGWCFRGKRVLLLRSCSRELLSLFSLKLSKYGCSSSCSQVSRSDGSILRQP